MHKGCGGKWAWKGAWNHNRSVFSGGVRVHVAGTVAHFEIFEVRNNMTGYASDSGQKMGGPVGEIVISQLTAS